MPEELAELRSVESADVEIVRLAENRGYAGGVNVALEVARRRGFHWLLMLNPDCVPTVELVREMLEIADGAAVVGVRQTTDPLDPAAEYRTAAYVKNLRPQPNEIDNVARSIEVDVVTGAGLLLDVAIALKAGGMDESFFHYKEEFDLVYRLRRDGAKVLRANRVALVHRRGGSLAGSSATARYYVVRNEILFFKKHGRFRHFPVGLVLRALDPRGKAREIRRAELKGVIDGFRGRGGRRGN
jgi:GT2 family glycosyltransferase